jgi:hypothetical protein
MIFTSPPSARGNLDAEGVPEPQGKRRKTPSKRPPVATQLKMDGRVTARAIAYAAVQVPRHSFHCSSQLTLFQLHFALNDATHWMSHYNGFNYEEFYKFIIKFFEDNDQTLEEKATASEVLNWWNRYVPGSRSVLAITDVSPGVFFHGLPPPEQPHLYHQSGCRLQSYNDNTECAHPTNTPSFDLHRVALIHMFI